MMQTFSVFMVLLIVLSCPAFARQGVGYESVLNIQGLIYAKYRTNYVIRDSGLQGQWHGVYHCLQGATSLILQVGPEDLYGDAPAVFMFSPTDYNPHGESGSFFMTVRKSYLKGGRYEFKPKKWLIRPEGYAMVGLTVNEITSSMDEILEIKGVVDQEGCTGFDLFRL